MWKLGASSPRRDAAGSLCLRSDAVLWLQVPPPRVELGFWKISKGEIQQPTKKVLNIIYKCRMFSYVRFDFGNFHSQLRWHFDHLWIGQHDDQPVGLGPVLRRAQMESTYHRSPWNSNVKNVGSFSEFPSAAYMRSQTSPSPRGTGPPSFVCGTCCADIAWTDIWSHLEAEVQTGRVSLGSSGFR